MSVDADLIVSRAASLPSDGRAAAPHEAAGWPLRRVAAVLALATLTMAMTNSQALVDWAFELPLAWGPVRTALVDGSESWHAAMASLGLDRPYIALREALFGFKALSCPA